MSSRTRKCNFTNHSTKTWSPQPCEVFIGSEMHKLKYSVFDVSGMFENYSFSRNFSRSEYFEPHGSDFVFFPGLSHSFSCSLVQRSAANIADLLYIRQPANEKMNEKSAKNTLKLDFFFHFYNDIKFWLSWNRQIWSKSLNVEWMNSLPYIEHGRKKTTKLVKS